MFRNTNITQEAYDAAAVVGRVTSIMKVIVGTFFGIIFIGLGIFMMLVKPDPSSSQPQNTKEITPIPKQANLFWVGLLFLLLGLFVLVVSWVWFYFAMTYKPVAAVTGVADTLGMVTQGIYGGPTMNLQENTEN